MKAIQVTQRLRLDVFENGEWKCRIYGITGNEPVGPGSRIVRVKLRDNMEYEWHCRGCDRDAEKCRCAKQ